MHWYHLWNDGLLISIHALAAIFSIVAGAVQFCLPKGTLKHKLLGRLWVFAMATVAATSLFIHELRLFGPFSPIHLLSIATLIGLWRMVWLARNGKVQQHKKLAVILYGLGLLLAGIFTLLPGRTMHAVLFSSL